MPLPRLNTFGFGFDTNRYTKQPKKVTNKLIKTIKHILLDNKLDLTDKNNSFLVVVSKDYLELRTSIKNTELYVNINQFGIEIDYKKGQNNYNSKIKSKTAYKKLKKHFKLVRDEYDDKNLKDFISESPISFQYNRELNLEKLLESDE